ncbi:1866_t:CDS:2, partial [Rhizophagus irregularis]
DRWELGASSVIPVDIEIMSRLVTTPMVPLHIPYLIRELFRGPIGQNLQNRMLVIVTDRCVDFLGSFFKSDDVGGVDCGWNLVEIHIAIDVEEFLRITDKIESKWQHERQVDR